MSPACFCVRGVELLAERHDVDALLTERGTNGRSGIRLSGRNLEFDLGYDFFSHKSRLLIKVDSCVKLNSELSSRVRPASIRGRPSVFRPKMLTETRSLPRSGSISSTTPLWFWNGPSATLTVSPIVEADLRFYLVFAAPHLRKQASTSDGRIGIGRSLVPANPITPGVSLMKYHVRSTSC